MPSSFFLNGTAVLGVTVVAAGVSGTICADVAVAVADADADADADANGDDDEDDV